MREFLPRTKPQSGMLHQPRITFNIGDMSHVTKENWDNLFSHKKYTNYIWIRWRSRKQYNWFKMNWTRKSLSPLALCGNENIPFGRCHLIVYLCLFVCAQHIHNGRRLWHCQRTGCTTVVKLTSVIYMYSTWSFPKAQWRRQIPWNNLILSTLIWIISPQSENSDVVAFSGDTAVRFCRRRLHSRISNDHS